MREPYGWHKSRKEAYLTTDLKLVSDPFVHEDRAFLSSLLDRRLARLLSRIYGIPVTSIRCNDMFIVRYDEGKRTSLRKHVDDVDISFNLLLSTNFSGGGTRFFNRLAGKLNNQEDVVFHHAQPQRAGQVLIHSSQVEHEGYPVETGTRFILAGFLSVDRVNPLTQRGTGLSLFASWLNAQWTQIRFRNAHHEFGQKRWGILSRAAQNGFAVAGALLLFLLDACSKHQYIKIVQNDKAELFLSALDRQYQNQVRNGEVVINDFDRASWFRGQHLHLSVDGSVSSVWETRRSNEEKFEEL